MAEALAPASAGAAEDPQQQQQEGHEEQQQLPQHVVCAAPATSQPFSQLDVMHTQQQQQQQGVEPLDRSETLQQQLQQLCSGIADLDGFSDLLVQLVHNIKQQTHPQPQEQQPCSTQHAGSTNAEQQDCRASSPGSQGNSSTSNSSNSEAVDELKQQLSALLAEKQRIEADRQDMALQQGKYKGTIAQLEGALAFSERKVKDQLTTIDSLQAQVASLTADLQQARGAAAQTPERCRTAARALQEEADRATTFAQNHEAQVKKLRRIVQLEARQLCELLDFAEQERLTLLEKEAALQQELEQVRSRAIAGEGSAADALAQVVELQQQLEATKEQLLQCQARVQQLEDALVDSDDRLQQSHEQAAVLAAERDAAARNLLRAEAELNDVSEYSTKMFRQVRFISHVLDKNSAVLGKLPEFASLTRDLRAFVAANARTWEPRDAPHSAATAVAAAAQPTMSNADTTASGMRDVAGKA